MDICTATACLIGAAITNADIGNKDPLSESVQYVDSQYIVGFEGESFDATQLFTQEHTPWEIDTVALLQDKDLDGDLTLIKVGYSESVDTAKLDIDPVYRLGFTRFQTLNDKWSVKFGVDVSYGGEARATPCYAQSYIGGPEEKYYCNTTTFTEYNTRLNVVDDYEDTRVGYGGHISITYKF